METASQSSAEALYRGHISTFILVLNIEQNLDLHTFRTCFYSFLFSSLSWFYLNPKQNFNFETKKPFGSAMKLGR